MLAYVLTNTPYNTPQDPQWREQGVEGGCLLFDGSSNYAAFSPDTIAVEGKTFSIRVWVAPRTFEWDDPNGAANGTEHLTAIVGQYNKEKKQGFLLGYQRFGRLCFQVGTGDEWITLWAEDGNLEKYSWNHVAAQFDGAKDTVSLYLNGVAVGTCSVSPGSSISPAEKEKLLVGKNAHAEAIAAGTYNMFRDLMDELKLYSRTLTAEELAPQEAPEIPFEQISCKMC